MNATSAVINDGVLWASAPIFFAAHLWPWHPLWAAAIWTAYGMSTLFTQGEALLSQMADSPLHYSFNPLHSRLCGLKYGSVILEMPTNSTNNQMIRVLVTHVASTSDLEYTTHAGGQDKSTSVVMVNAVRVDDKPGPLSTTQWSASDDIEGHSDFSVLSISDSSASLVHEATPLIQSSSPALGQSHSSKRSSLTSSPSPSSVIVQPLTGTGLEMLDRPTPPSVGDHLSPPSFGWLRLFKNRLSLGFADYQIWGRPARQWWPSLAMCCFNLFVLWCVYSTLLWAHRKMVREPLPPISPTAAPSKVPAANTSMMVVSEAAAPTSNQRTLGPAAQSTPANRDTIVRQYIQQWNQGLVHYRQVLKKAFPARKIHSHIWVAKLVWGGNHQPFAQIIRVTAILVCCMLLAWIFLEAASSGLMRVVHNVMHQPVFARKVLTSRSTAFQAPDRIAGTIFNCLWQIKQCTNSALQTRLSPDGSYPSFPASSSHTGIICERILRTIMSYKAIRLTISRTFSGEVLLQ